MSFLRTLPPLALLALSVGAVACSAEPLDEEMDDEAAIINGENSGTEDDAVVALYRREQPICAATLIGKNTLVTALHCVTEMTTQQAAVPGQVGGQGGQVGAPQRQPMLGARMQPHELTIRMGARPAARATATVSKILVPDPVRMDSGQPIPMGSNDVAILYVQSSDPAFGKLRPRRLGQRSPQIGSMVKVVGYGGEGTGSASRLTQRQKRDTEVVASAGQRLRVTAELDTGERIPWDNLPREFTTKTVACGGDSGGPAFDAEGNIVGLVSAIVGKCVEGSLSVFTDLASHAQFLSQAVTNTASTVGCLDDSECGGPTSGTICDIRTNRCMRGCRSGVVQCPAGMTCSVQGRSEALAGMCRSANNNGGGLGGFGSDPFYDSGPYVPPSMPGVTCPGNPLCPTTTAARECQTDAECGGVNGQKPRVCDVPLGRCLDGCRVATPGMCVTGQVCGAYNNDPAIGVCQVATLPPPPPVPASPPIVASPDPAAATPAATDPAASTTTESAAAKKKKKNKAKGEEAGCSVTAIGGETSSTLAPLGLALLGLASLRRRRRS